MRFTFIKWKDHAGFSEGGWKTEEDILDLCVAMIYSTGFIIKETADSVTIAAHWDNTNCNGTGCMLINKELIVTRKDKEVNLDG